MGDRQFQQHPKESHLLALFRSMTDDCQDDALSAMESLAADSPRRPAVALRLVSASLTRKASGDA